MSTQPTISVIMPVRNEERVLEAVITSLLAQRCDGFELEILVVDGDSTDRSADIARACGARDPRVRVLENARQRTPFAMNIGLKAARGDYVAILGAHSVYDEDYLATCLDELRARGAVGVSGRIHVVPAGPNASARLASWLMSHPFGSSPRSCRNQPQGEVDTIPFGVFSRAALLAAGGYDETLLRNQDNDMNQRLRAAGGTLYCTWRTSCRYVARPSLRAALGYATLTGRWNAFSLRTKPESMGLRHMVPVAFVLAILGGALLTALGLPWSEWPWRLAPVAAPMAAHLAVGTASALQVSARERAPLALALPACFFAFHVAYGWATLAGVITGFAGGSSDQTELSAPGSELSE